MARRFKTEKFAARAYPDGLYDELCEEIGYPEKYFFTKNTKEDGKMDLPTIKLWKKLKEEERIKE